MSSLDGGISCFQEKWQEAVEHCVDGLVQISCPLGYSEVTMEGDNEKAMKTIKKESRWLEALMVPGL